MIQYPSASAHATTMRCVGPALIPLHHSRTSDAAEGGTDAHETCLPAMIGRVPFGADERGRFLARMGVTKGRIEVAIAMDPRSMQAVELGEGLDRNYSDCPPGWIPMTLDLFDIDKPHLTELKTGGVPVELPYLNAQIRSQAVGAWMLTDRVPTVRLVKAPKDAPGFWAWWAPGRRKPTLGELYAWRGKLVGMMDRIDAQRDVKPANLSLTQGEHCRYCDVRRARACPAIDGWLADVGGDPFGEHARAIVARQVAKERQDDAETALRDHPDVEIKTTHRRKLQAGIAIVALPELEGYAVPSITMGALDRYVRDHKLSGETWADARARIEAVLYDFGALTYTSKENLVLPSNGS